MKRTFFLIALVAICSAMMVSCKNTRTAEPTPEEIKQQKQALADSVLADIDALAEQFYNTQSKSFKLKSMELTEEEKMVKPDYLLDPSVASNFVTKSQKVNALAIYAVERIVRTLYDMPCDEVTEVVAILAAAINHPIDADYMTSEAPESEKMKRDYEICKERGDLAYFWQFQYAVMSELSYIVASNPELFYSKITDEQWQIFCSRFMTIEESVEKLAEYDEEMSQLYEFRSKHKIYPSQEEKIRIYQSKELSKQFHIANKDKYVARRNDLLQCPTQRGCDQIDTI